MSVRIPIRAVSDVFHSSGTANRKNTGVMGEISLE
jgi:hypothetical protein